jgi:DNA topoisomerase-1
MINIVIVESPAKTKKISGYLGPNFRVLASCGHIRDLPSKSMGIDLNNEYKATWQITKQKVVSELKKACSTASTVYLAMDNDREGHGIAWHLTEVLKLSYPKAKRMIFNEITKSAILTALDKANQDGKMNMPAVNSYKARCFSDKIVGFKVSPLLWKNVTGAKSGGRCQSVTTKLVVERENEIEKHIPEEKYLISGIFLTDDEDKISASLKQVPKEHKEALEVLKYCKDSEFTVSENSEKVVYHTPPPAFKTSTLQQEAGKRFSISPKDAMRIAQTLYEKGKITYHRTDVTRLSNQFKGEVKTYVENKYGNEYLSDDLKKFEFKPDDITVTEKKTKKKKGDKNVQAAHEAIRPTDVNTPFLTGEGFDQKEKLIYKMIWISAVSSLMAKEKCNRYSITISLSNIDKYWFVATYLLSVFLGFKILNDKKKEDTKNKIVMDIKKDDELTYETIESKQTYTQPLNRFTESSLIKELENKGIGRPSTFSSIINTIQTRKYVIKQKSTPIKKECLIDVLKDNKITSKTLKVDFGDKKQKLFPTELGIKVTKFLTDNLDYMMDYKFTSNLENELDEISTGNKDWLETVDGLTKTLEKLIDKVPERERPTREELKMNKDNRTVLNHEGSAVEFYVGQYGPFIKYKGKCYSLPKECTELSSVTPDVVVGAINKKKSGGSENLVSYECKIDGKAGTLQGLTGKFGNYLRFAPENGDNMINYFLPKDLKEDADAVSKLTLEECLKQVDFVSNYKKKQSKK